MSEKLNYLKKEVTDYRNRVKDDDDEYIRQQDMEIERQRNLLEKAGIRKFFEEIIKDGEIRLSDKPVYEPARIVERVSGRSSRALIGKIPRPDPLSVSISLLYNKRNHNYYEYGVVHDEVTFAVIEGEVCLVGINNRDYPIGERISLGSLNWEMTHTPLNERGVEELVAERMKHPIFSITDTCV